MQRRKIAVQHQTLLLEHKTTAVNYCLQLWYEQQVVQVRGFGQDTA